MVLIMDARRSLTEDDLKYTPVSVEKTSFLTGRYDFAAREVFKWYDERTDYLKAKDGPDRDEVYGGERKEYSEAKRDYWENIRYRDVDLDWHEDPNYEQIWTVVSEAADVAIVAASELKLEGFPPEWVACLWRGDYDDVLLTGKRAEFRDDLKLIRGDLDSIGVDLAEAIVEKNALNEQHYPHFYPWVLVSKIGSEGDLDTVARMIRKDVGPIGSSQMYDLTSHPKIGETNLSRAQRTPFSIDGFSPQAIYIRPTGQVELGPSDRDHTYEGLYSVGAIRWLFDDFGHRFHHDARMADYRYYFTHPEWRETLSALIKTDINELVVPSGSNFRFEGLQSLAEHINFNFEKLGEVDDELRWKQYVLWCEDNEREVNIFDFQRRVVQGKEARLDVRHDNEDATGEHKGAVVAMDEIILFWNDETLKFEAVERPENEEEAIRQIKRLVSGEQVFISNATIVTSLQQNGMGEGLAVQIIPMKIKCETEDEKLKLEQRAIEAYRMAAKGEDRWKVTPGGISMLHDVWQPYQTVTIYRDLKSMVIPDHMSGHTELFAWDLVEKGEEIAFLDLPEKMQNEIGISVGGLSLAGLRVAIERFLLAKEKYEKSGEVDHDRVQRLDEIREMMKIGSEA